MLPLVVCFQFLCHFVALCSSNSLFTTLCGILLYSSSNDSFVAAFFASVSAISFPNIPTCAFTQQSVISQLVLFISIIFNLSSFVMHVWILLFCSFSSVILLSVYIVIVLSVL